MINVISLKFNFSFYRIIDRENEKRSVKNIKMIFFLFFLGAVNESSWTNLSTNGSVSNSKHSMVQSVNIVPNK